jgi:hypothetical protein
VKDEEQIRKERKFGKWTECVILNSILHTIISFFVSAIILLCELSHCSNINKRQVFLIVWLVKNMSFTSPCPQPPKSCVPVFGFESDIPSHALPVLQPLWN